jgi:membrane protein implicated in regulation of membrane protease activity
MLPDLTQYLWIAWLVLAVVFVIIELLTLEFTFLMLAAGAVIGGLGVNLLGGPWWLQVLIAAAVSALLLFTIRPLCSPRCTDRASRTRRTSTRCTAWPHA